MELNKKNIRTLLLGAAGCIVLYWLLHEEARVKALWTSFVGIISPFVLGAGLAFI